MVLKGKRLLFVVQWIWAMATMNLWPCHRVVGRQEKKGAEKRYQAPKVSQI